MLEEKDGWVAGDGQKHEEMADAVIEVMAEANQHNMREDLNPFKVEAGEILPLNLERNYSGFLMKKDAIKFKVNTDKLLARILCLKE